MPTLTPEQLACALVDAELIDLLSIADARRLLAAMLKLMESNDDTTDIAFGY